MHYCKKKPKNIRSFSILFFIFSCLPIAFIFILLRFIPKALPLMEAYINSGSSFFVPIIPNINLLPEKGQLIGLTLGQLIDIIIMVNLLGFIESSIYHFFKKKFSIEQFSEISLTLNWLTTEEELFLSSQEQDDLFGLEVNLLFLNNCFNKDFVKTFNIYQKDLLFYYLHALEQDRKFKNDKRFYTKSKFISYYYNKNRVSSLFTLFKLKNPYLKNINPLLICNFPTIFNESIRGEELLIMHLKFKIKSMLNPKLIISRKSE